MGGSTRGGNDLKWSKGRLARRVALRSASALLVLLAGAPLAAAEPLHFNGTMSFQIGSVGIEFSGSGDVAITGLSANPRISLPAAAFAGQVVVPVTDPNVFPIAAVSVDGSNQAGTFERPAPGQPIGGTMPLTGLAKVCLYAACDASPLANLTVPLSVVGRAATAFATGPVNLTVIGAPWTTGSLALGESSFVSGSVQAGADHISLNLVTPIFISSNLGAYPRISAHARLTLVAGADCDNGLDDDGDGAIDHPADDGCVSADDISEAFGTGVEACRNGFDDDGDGSTDFGAGADPGCSSLRDGSERSASLPCDNDLDDDHDGLKDGLDPGCTSPTDPDEADLGDGVCNDGQDQDFDGFADFPLDPGCTSIDDADERESWPATTCSTPMETAGRRIPRIPAAWVPPTPTRDSFRSPATTVSTRTATEPSTTPRTSIAANRRSDSTRASRSRRVRTASTTTGTASWTRPTRAANRRATTQRRSSWTASRCSTRPTHSRASPCARIRQGSKSGKAVSSAIASG